LTYKALCREKEVRSEGKRSDLQKKRLIPKKRSDIRMLYTLRKVEVETSERKRSDLQKRGKICKLYALIKVRIVKSLRSGSFVLCRSKISEMFLFLKHGSRYV
jgi:hypothetical protein